MMNLIDYIKYRKIISSNHAYKARQFILKMSKKNKLLTPIQKYKLIQIISMSADEIIGILTYAQIIPLSGNERLILIKNLIDINPEHIWCLLSSNQFQFLMTETDLMVGRLIRYNNPKLIKKVCDCVALPIEHYNLLSSKYVMDELSKS